LTRWPDQTNEEFVMDPFEATMENVIKISNDLAQIVDDEFELENADRWDGASIFINLSNPICKRDGQGWTGTADIVNGKIRTKAGGSGRYETCGNWHIGDGTKYYLFNPKPSAVEAIGGVTALLSNGEWWKKGDTLFIKTPDGNSPASSLEGGNLVEAKKYPFAFRPEAGGTFSDVTIKNLNNVLHDCLARAYDAGVIDGSRSKNGLRVDHNIIYNSPEFLQIGIYLDYGDFIDGIEHHPGELIVDHNVIYNVHNAIQPNACSYMQIYNNTILHSSGGFAIGGVHLEDEGVIIQNNFGTPDDFGRQAVVRKNLNTGKYLDTYFTDPEHGDFTLSSNAIEAIDSAVNVIPFNGRIIGMPDIGAYEYGTPPWSAGASEDNIYFHLLSIQEVNGNVHPASGLYRAGDTIPIEAGDILGHTFDNWSGDISGTADHLEIIMDTNINITANYREIPTYTLEVIADKGYVKILSVKDIYNEGEKVGLIPVPMYPYKFDSWSGDTTGFSNPITITMNDNKTITANFVELDKYLVTTSADNGMIRLNPSGGEYYKGTLLSVWAIPDEGYQFGGWAGNEELNDTLTKQYITVNEDMNISAQFTPTGINDKRVFNKVIVYPVPIGIDELLSVEFKEDLIDQLQVRIYDLAGKVLYSRDFFRNQFTIPVSEIDGVQKGVHVIEISNGRNIHHVKLIIK
jgi:hypothetical protein